MKRRTRHRIAAAEPATKQLISNLKRDWKRGRDRVELGQQIHHLTDKEHCSFRGLGIQIGKAEATLRRYAALYLLPEAERTAFLQGETAKNVLARKAARDRQERSRARIKREQETGELSDDAADLILDFCRFEDGEEEGAICLWSHVIPLLEQTRALTRRGNAYPIPGKIPRDRKQLFKRSRPPKWRGLPEFWLTHRAGWLAMILMTVVPEEEIREIAMNKAEHRRYELDERSGS